MILFKQLPAPQKSPASLIVGQKSGACGERITSMRKRATAAALILALLPLIGCTLLPNTVRAATITAASCSRNDVGTAVNNAVNGDIVRIPAGTCTWTTTLTINAKYLTLEGAGANSTIIVDGVSKAAYPNVPHVLVWTTPTAGLSRLAGMTFQGQSQDTSNKGMVIIKGASHSFRIDHNKFVPNGTTAMFLYGDLWGVIDHNVFDMSAQKGYGLYVMGAGYGDASWADGSTLGTGENVFLEDNLFTQDRSKGFFYPAMDGWAGHRVVFRYNQLNAVKIGNHGTESGGRQRSARQYEYYNNTWTWDMYSPATPSTSKNGYPSLFAIRGGTGVIYNNTATITNGSVAAFADFQYYRAGTSYSPWGKCPSIWDQSATRCLDQTGVGGGTLLSGTTPTPSGWPDQANDPAYVWNNKINGVISAPISQVPSVVQEGRDFILTAKPGYTPYTYPHPLVSGATVNPGPIIPAPTGLSVQ